MNDKRKKKQSYYQKGGKKFKQYILEAGLQGFLCSCNNREKDCVREAYNILNKYTDKLYGAEKKAVDEPEEKSEEIEDELEKEIKNLKEENTKPTMKKFQVVESGAKNFLFIRTTMEDPVNIAHTIVKDIHESKTPQTRFLIRLIPIEVTCKAYINDIKAAVEPLIEKYFSDEPKVFSIVYNHRNNNNLKKDEVIKTIADLVTLKRTDHVVDLKAANVSIIVEVIKNIVLISVVPDYFKYKKYNVLVDSAIETESTKSETELNKMENEKEEST